MSRTLLAPPFVTKTTTYTASVVDATILANGTFTVWLYPAASAPGQTLLIKNIGTGSVTVAANGAEHIDANSTYVIANGQSLSIMTNGTQWWTAGGGSVATSPSSTTFTATAGETLSTNQVVYFKSDGLVYKMSSTMSGNPAGPFLVTTGGNQGDSVVLQMSGIATGLSNLIAGRNYYVSALTAGSMSAAPQPYSVMVGLALSSTTMLLGKVGNTAGAVYGYISGGNTYTSPASPSVVTDRLSFSTSTTVAHTASNLSQARYYLASISDAAAYGYVLGGTTGAAPGVDTADRVTFSSSTAAAWTAAKLSGSRYGNYGVSDGITYGYSLGGTTGASIVTTDRVSFSTSATAAFTAANLSSARSQPNGLSDGVTYGYALGGYSSASAITGDRITFSTSATAAFTTSNLSQARYAAAGVSDGQVYGFVLGGSTGAAVATTDRVTFSTSTTAAYTTANLSLGRHGGGGISDGSIFGYVLGGWYTNNNGVTTADQITFSSCTLMAYTASNLSLARYAVTGMSDGAV